MANVKVYNVEGEEVSSIELKDSIFGIKINEHLVHMAVVHQLANKRQGTQSTKTRAEVRGGGRKPWRQKGTGRARQGSIRSPQWKGGGVVFAPKPRDYSFKMNKKERVIAIKSVLTSKVNTDKLIVLDELSFDEIKTKQIKTMLDSFKIDKALIILDKKDENVTLSARNLPKVRTVLSNSISVYDVLKYDTVLLSKEAVAKIEEVYA
ncbi:MAG TPA: 50S ribosomal protein L4 [Clostridiales bacterium]|nr:50S ribosomal protein L4 [Clostridiales bacterium]